MQALKKFGLGIIWALLFPFVVVVSAIVGIFGLGSFFVEFVIMVINFVRGEKLFPLYPEEKRAMEILQRAIDRRNGEAEAQASPQPQPQQIVIQQNFYGQPPVPPGTALPPGYNQALPPGYGQQQLPPGYGQPLPPGYNQPLPPGYNQPLPPLQGQEAPIPERPPLAELPQYDPSSETEEDDDE